MKHPIQKIEDHRFVKNEIVDYLLENGNIDLNTIARMPFDDEDRQQFAQLIGYSLSGYAELSYVTDEAYVIAAEMSKDSSITELESQNIYLKSTLDAVKAGLKAIVPEVFCIHPDDLKDHP